MSRTFEQDNGRSVALENDGELTVVRQMPFAAIAIKAETALALARAIIAQHEETGREPLAEAVTAAQEEYEVAIAAASAKLRAVSDAKDALRAFDEKGTA